ncbi:hypothetical protein [Gordonia crocea]|uniref:Lipoprotein n=1 Tax=Gordonia crocea TaxID=589162 RepID=A0A7I9UVL2_9ACTN|nr:hypothetical protein [Gordonia crocea]GED96800.1 hypothetical protein nbrc107697_08390 [Gordonia crocea]
MRWRASGAAALVCASAVIGGCTFDNPNPEPSPTTTTAWGAVAHDTSPFLKHFPALGKPVAASWSKGSPSTPSKERIDLPGPSSTRLDAVVTVDPAVAARLRTEVGEPDPDSSQPPPPATPELAPALQVEVPPGPFIVGRSTLGTTYGWNCVVYVDRTRPVVVVVASLPWATGFTGAP